MSTSSITHKKESGHRTAAVAVIVIGSPASDRSTSPPAKIQLKEQLKFKVKLVEQEVIEIVGKDYSIESVEPNAGGRFGGY